MEVTKLRENKSGWPQEFFRLEFFIKIVPQTFACGTLINWQRLKASF